MPALDFGGAVALVHPARAWSPASLPLKPLRECDAILSIAELVVSEHRASTHGPAWQGCREQAQL